MRLQDFVEERRDDSPDWAELFEKYDCVFVVSEEEFPKLYEHFKQELADHLFDLRYGYQHLCEQIETYYKIKLRERADGCADILKSFLQLQDRPTYLRQPSQFLDAFREYAEAGMNHLRISPAKYIQLTTELLHMLSVDIRGSFVSLEDTSKKFAQMTSQIGEVLAELVFSQLRGCGSFTRAKTDLDNPNMPRHGEDLLAFFFGEAADGVDDQLFLVEAKSTKGSISQPVREIRDRFTDHLRKLPGYEITRLKHEIQKKVGPRRAALTRKRISRLVWKAKLDPESNQLKFSPFLHYRERYSPRKETLSILGEVGVDPCRMHVIVFKFAEFEKSVREIFERAWTI